MNAVGAMIKRNLLNFVRNKSQLFGTILMPLFFLFIFSFLMKSAMSGFAQPMNYLIAGIIIMTVFQGSISNSTAILSDIASGFMREILVAPISRTQISVGHILSAGIISVLQGLLLTLISLLIGLRLDPVHLLEMIGVMALAGVTFSSIGLFLATISRNSASFQIISMVVVMPFTFLSGAYIPTTIMPGFLMPLVYLNPLTYLTAVFRYISLEMEHTPAATLVKEGVAYDIHGFLITPGLGLLITLLIGLVFLVLCVRQFDRADFSNVKVAAGPRH